MKIFLLIISGLFVVTGCERPSGRWRALEDVPVFKEANEADELDFIVKKDEICALGREKVVKVFMYKQISCARGRGWVMYSKGYRFEKLD